MRQVADQQTSQDDIDVLEFNEFVIPRGPDSSGSHLATDEEHVFAWRITTAWSPPIDSSATA